MHLQKYEIIDIIQSYSQYKEIFLHISLYFRAQFVCTGCEKLRIYTVCWAAVSVVDLDQEEFDEYVLETRPDTDDHQCIKDGMEDQSKMFVDRLLHEARDDPCQLFPALYKNIRYERLFYVT